MTDRFAQLGYVMVRLRWIVLAVWLIILGVAGGILSPKTTDVVKGGGFIIDGSESARAAEILESDFGAATQSNVVVVFRDTERDVKDPELRAEIEERLGHMAALPGVTRVASYYSTGLTDLVSEDQHTQIALVAMSGDEGEIQDRVGELRAELDDMSMEHYITGLPAINYDTEITSEHDLRRSEMFTIPIVVILLLLVFRTVISAAIPLIVGAVSVITTLGLLYLVGSRFDTSIFALNVASMIGLGLGIDFCLIVINRFREERAAGYDTSSAVARTMATAGRSITYSGITVILAMGVLTLMLRDVMIVRSISLAVMLVAMVALLAGMTLLPAVLGILQHRLEWLPVLPRRKKTAAAAHEGIWYRISHAIMARPGMWLFISLAILAVCAWPIRNLSMVGASTGSLPKGNESVQGARIMDEAFGSNQLTPIQIVLKSDEPGGIWNTEFLTGITKLTQLAQADLRVAEVSSLRTFVPFYSDERFAEYVRQDFFSPAPEMRDWTNLSSVELPDVEFETVIYAQVPQVPPAPAFVGLGAFSLDPGTAVAQRSAPAFQVIRVMSGSLTVTAQGPTDISTEATNQQQTPAPVGEPFTVNAGEQLVIPSNTVIELLSNESEPTDFLTVTMFVERSSTDPQQTWVEGQPSPDVFEGIPRRVLAGGVSMYMPPGSTTIQVDRATAQPGAFFPKHVHPGPELIAVEQGEFTIFAAPPNEMTMTGATGQVEEGEFDTPITLGPGSKALVQGYQVHRGRNLGTETTVFYSARVYDATVLPFILVGPTQRAVQFVNLEGDNDASVVTIISRYGQYDDRHQALVTDLREEIIPGIPELAGYEVFVGGDSAGFMDFRDKLYGRFPLVAGAVMLLIFIILMMFFQSVFLPLKAIFMNLVSVVATYGILVVIFQYGHGAELLGFESQGLLNVITPAILFVILFALSTDYEVFMLSRVKEYYHETKNNEEAVAAGLQHTAGVITAAGLILIGTFGSFASARVVTIKEIGIGLAIGVLIDSTIVRVIMVPATMRLMGATNWWMPDWLKRIVPELHEGPAPAMAGAGAHGPAPALSGGGVAHDRYAASGSGVMSMGSSPSFQPQQVQPLVGQIRPLTGSIGPDAAVLPRDRPFTIGRDPSCVLQVFDARVSRRHCAIEYTGGHYIVSDLNSANGVYVNGQRISEPTELRHEDQIEIGNFGTIILQFLLVPEPATASAAASAPG